MRNDAACVRRPGIAQPPLDDRSPTRGCLRLREEHVRAHHRRDLAQRRATTATTEPRAARSGACTPSPRPRGSRRSRRGARAGPTARVERARGAGRAAGRDDLHARARRADRVRVRHELVGRELLVLREQALLQVGHERVAADRDAQQQHADAVRRTGSARRRRGRRGGPAGRARSRRRRRRAARPRATRPARSGGGASRRR